MEEVHITILYRTRRQDTFADDIIAFYRDSDKVFGKEEIPRDELMDAYRKIKEAAEDFDSDEIDRVIESLSAYSIPEDESERFEKIRESAEAMDWDALEEALADI